MPPKILFSEEENKNLILIFEQSENYQSKQLKDYVVETFLRLCFRKISYNVLRNQFMSLNKLKRDLSDFTLKNTNNRMKKNRQSTENNSINTENIGTHITDNFLAFLTNIFDRGQIMIKFKQHLNHFLYDFNMKEIMINSDGLCFLSAVRIFFKNILNIEYSIENIKAIIFNFFTINQIENVLQSALKHNYLIGLNICLNNI